jgi:hypothetical protein
MSRNTKPIDQTGHFDRNVPLSEDPDMVELKELVRELEPDRRDILDEVLGSDDANQDAEPFSIPWEGTQ